MKDVTRYHAMTYPTLYLVCQRSQHLKSSHFMMLLWQSMYQAVCIFVMGSLLFETSFLKIVTISFSALVLTELCNIITLVDRLNVYIITANILSFFFYVISLVFFRAPLGLQAMDWPMIKNTLLIVLCCWLPFELIKMANRYFFPTVSDKIMQTVMKKDKNIIEQELQLESNNDLLSRTSTTSN